MTTLLKALGSCALCLWLSTTIGAETFVDPTCGPLYGLGVGPLDYQGGVQTDTLKLVEGAHFTPGVETLTQGATGHFGGDIDYTLRAYPNHYRALAAMSRLSFKEKRSRPNGARFTVECYFERAIRWRPEDASVRLVWGIHLLKAGNKKDGISQLEKAIALGIDSGNAHYNLGLALFEVGEYSRSARHAIRASQLNFTLPGLKEKLRKAGKWPSPEEESEIAESFSLLSNSDDAAGKSKDTNFSANDSGSRLAP